MPPFFRGNHTEVADTAIREVIPAYRDMVPSLDSFRYLADFNEHTMTIMRPVGTATVTKAASTGDTRFTLSTLTPSGQEVLATSDWLIWVDENNTYQADEIVSIVGNDAVLTDVLPTAIEKGAKVWALYEVARSAHTQLVLPSNVTTDFNKLGITAGYDEPSTRLGDGDPLLIHIDNVSMAGTLRYLCGRYLSKTNVVDRSTEIVLGADGEPVATVEAPPPPPL